MLELCRVRDAVFDERWSIGSSSKRCAQLPLGEARPAIVKASSGQAVFVCVRLCANSPVSAHVSLESGGSAFT
jgi:hypothetical protein